ncbi:MAG: redoxin family protein [Patescibacteria group bacterium]
MKRGTLITIGLIVIVIVGAAALASALPMSKLGGLGSGNAISSATGTSGLPILANQMPDFTGITNWWNTPNNQPLTPAGLKGKVVLVDFWTYSCINCIRTYPFLKSMYAKYADDGLVIVGVHTPEFAFESDPNNVEQAILQNGLKYPVALDANYGTWNAYGNEYWPAEYLFDREGRLRHTQFGEGDYDQSEEAIRSLLTENSNVTLAPMGVAVATPDLSNIQTDETYFGLERGSAFMGTPSTSGTTATFTASATVGQNQWTAGGSWQFDPEFVETAAANDVFRFNVQANVLHIVLDSADGKDKTLDVYVDGKKTGTVTVNMSKLYDIATFADGGRHTVELRIHDAGVRFYAATFS